MKDVSRILFIMFLVACGNSNSRKSVELIPSIGKQDSLFKSLIAITENGIPEAALDDSLAFLVLPVQASCPSCRKKTIDSLIKHKKNLLDGHFVIISAGGGYKTINRYFLEQDEKMPVMIGKLFLDSTNMAYRHDLYKDNPTMYYTYSRKTYKKVSAYPATVREDLREFFSGYR